MNQDGTGLRPRTRAGDDGLHVDIGDGDEVGGRNGGTGFDVLCGVTVGGLHPEAIVLVSSEFNAGEPLNPGVAGPAGGDDAKGEAMLGRQRFAIHFVGEQRVLMVRFFQRKGALEFRHLAHRGIGTVKQKVRGSRLQARLRQNVAETDSGPLRIAHTAEAPLCAGHARLVETAPITGAFEDADEVHFRQLLQISQRQLQGRIDQARDFEVPGSSIHLRCESVAADEEVPDWRDFIDEAFNRHLQIDGSGRERNHLQRSAGAVGEVRCYRGGKTSLQQVASSGGHAVYSSDLPQLPVR